MSVTLDLLASMATGGDAEGNTYSAIAYLICFLEATHWRSLFVMNERNTQNQKSPGSPVEVMI